MTELVTLNEAMFIVKRVSTKGDSRGWPNFFMATPTLEDVKGRIGADDDYLRGTLFRVRVYVDETVPVDHVHVDWP